MDIIYEDAYCFAVNKPNNLIVHHSYYARNIEETSLVELVRQTVSPSASPIHRLDRKTSGVILFAKEKEFVAPFQSSIEQEDTQKQYLALVRGHIIEPGIIDSPVKNENGNYKEALTHYQPIQQFTLNIPVEPYSTARYTYIHYFPKTGRTHQLRIHSNKISHPIIGDHKYGNRHHNRLFEEQFNLPNLFLHAEQLKFIHPFMNEQITIKADLPEFWMEFERKITPFIIY